MSVFFLLSQLDVDRELLDGRYTSWSAQILPDWLVHDHAAARGAAFKFNSPARFIARRCQPRRISPSRWGSMALLGRRHGFAEGLVTALAIFDDLRAIAIIGVAYTDKISAPWLLAAGATLLCLLSLQIELA